MFSNKAPAVAAAPFKIANVTGPDGPLANGIFHYFVEVTGT